MQPDVVAYTSLLAALQGTPQASGVLCSPAWRCTALRCAVIVRQGLAAADGQCWPRRRPTACMQAAPAARELWRGMQADGVRPNGMAVAAFVEILLLEGEIDEALQVPSSILHCSAQCMRSCVAARAQGTRRC